MSSLPDKLNLGCGNKKRDGWLNVDRAESIKPDQVHDLNQYPYPWPDSSFSEIQAYDVIEHLDDIPAFMNEIWRLGKPQAVVQLTTPHFSCANSYVDPTHQNHLSYFSLDYFTAGHPWGYYCGSGFEIKHRQIVFTPSLVNRVVSRMANKDPHCYENRWAWICPAWFLYFELAVIK